MPTTFHLGCIAIYVWIKCRQTNFGYTLAAVPCPLCVAPTHQNIAAPVGDADQSSCFPCLGSSDSNVHRSFQFINNYPAPICFSPLPFFPVPPDLFQSLLFPWTFVSYNFSNVSILGSQVIFGLMNEQQLIRQIILQINPEIVVRQTPDDLSRLSRLPTYSIGTALLPW